MSQIAPAADAVDGTQRRDGTAYLRQLEFASVELSLKNLMTFPFVKAAVEKGELLPARRLFRRRVGQAAGQEYQDGRVRAGRTRRDLADRRRQSRAPARLASQP